MHILFLVRIDLPDQLYWLAMMAWGFIGGWIIATIECRKEKRRASPK